MTDNHLQNLARSILPGIEKFYQDPKNLAEFERWKEEKAKKEKDRKEKK